MSVFTQRRRRVRNWLEANGVDALLIASAANVRYLFGFSGEGIGVIGETAALSTDRRYEIAAAEIPGRVSIEVHSGGHLAGAMEQVRKARVRRLGFEAEKSTYASYEDLKAKLDDVELVATRQVVERIRMVKDKDEVAAIARAAAIMDEALTATIEALAPGVTEREVALDLERAALEGGADKIAFETICAFGPSAAHPHAVPGDRVLEAGQMVKIDCGAKVDGYCSDITRTVIVGEADERTEEVYGVVFEAQQAAVEAAKPGMKASELDAVARDIITEAGFGKEFSHGLGHGVGLEVHEGPRVSAQSKDTLKAGMVITVEPGVYIEGWGGVRIEDTVAITRAGCEVLTRTAKQGTATAI